MLNDQLPSSFPAAGLIVPAAGTGTRMKSTLPKQLLNLAGIPIIARAILPFLEIKAITTIIVVVHPSHEQAIKDVLFIHLPPDTHHKLCFIYGGKLRQDSVYQGLKAMPPEVELVLVHDAARPMVTARTILETMKTARKLGAAIAAIPVKDTLKKVTSNKIVEHTVDRASLWQAQTPQVFQRVLLEKAYKQAQEAGLQITDEASLLEHMDISVHIVQGSERNQKITHPGDVQLATTLVQGKLSMKIGHGYDAHRLVPDRPLVLGGEKIDHHLGLAGHSDADVVCHALADALLGALGAGDIGQHFPDNDDQYKNISSIVLLALVMELVVTAGMRVKNGDITIVCQKPKLAPYMAKMKHNLSTTCLVPPEMINLKATTTEQMGFTGRSEGIATHAVVLLEEIEHGC